MHAGNRFSIILRDFEIDIETLERRLELIQVLASQLFAEQRFGWDANNLVKADDLINQNKLKGNRHGTDLFVRSAVWLFNLLLIDI